MIEVDKSKCLKCGGCVSVCPVGALTLSTEKGIVCSEKCINCKACINFCPVRALKEK